MTLENALPLFPEPADAASEQVRLHSVVAPALPPPSAPQPRLPRKAAWLALHFPAWPMAAVLSGMTAQQRLALQARPFAVIDQDRKRRVLVCNEQARTCGVRPGHSLNAAIALCSELQVTVRDLDREAALLETAARACQRYTSTVSIEPPHELLLEVRGSFRLFGGAAALVRIVLDDFAARGIAVSAALTPTVRSALWLSRGPQSLQIIPPRALPAALMRLPVAVLQWPQDIALRLARFGVSTVGDLRRLPRGGLAKRIGARHLAELDAALGQRPELRRAIMELPRYRDRVILDAEIETTGLLEALIATRLIVLERFLLTRSLALAELVIELVHRVPPVTLVRTGLAMPTTDMGHLRTLIHERLGALQLPAPILELRLHATHLVSATGRSKHLFHSGQGGGEGLQHRLARLVETLESRLGKQACSALQVVAEHRPEHAQSRGAMRLAAAGQVRSRCEIPDCLPQRPMWLLREPASLGATLRAEEFLICSGPESIESGWWDAKPCRRDYFIAHSKQGALCWIFRDLAGQGAGEWYLQGLFG